MVLEKFKTSTYPSSGTALGRDGVGGISEKRFSWVGRRWRHLRKKKQHIPLWRDGVGGICNKHPSRGMALAAVQMSKPLWSLFTNFFQSHVALRVHLRLRIHCLVVTLSAHVPCKVFIGSLSQNSFTD